VGFVTRQAKARAKKPAYSVVVNKSKWALRGKLGYLVEELNHSQLRRLRLFSAAFASAFGLSAGPTGVLAISSGRVSTVALSLETEIGRDDRSPGLHDRQPQAGAQLLRWVVRP